MGPRILGRVIGILLLACVLVGAGGCRPHKTAARVILRPAFKITKKTLKGTVHVATKMLKGRRAKRVAVSIVKKSLTGDPLSFDPNDAALCLVETIMGEAAADGIEMILCDPMDLATGKIEETVTHYLIVEPIESYRKGRGDHRGEDEVVRYRATLKDAKTGEVVDESEIEVMSEPNAGGIRSWVEQAPSG
jgi:hypothetical protein